MKDKTVPTLSDEEKASVIAAALNGTSPEFLCHQYQITFAQYRQLCSEVLSSWRNRPLSSATRPTNLFVLRVLGLTCLLAVVFVLLEILVRQAAYEVSGIFLHGVVGEQEIDPNKIHLLLVTNLGVFLFLFGCWAAVFVVWGRLVSESNVQIRFHNAVSYFFAVLLGAFKTLEMASLVRVLHKDPFWIHSLMVGVATVFLLALAIDFFVKVDSVRTLDFFSETLRLLKAFVNFSNKKIVTEMIYGLILGAVLVSVLSLIITGLDNSINYLFIHKINRITPT
ncbi:hypothetical protein [Nitrospina gracilis]|uniref:hypothetical protein n=1 Tax=Nitrospina gracilis TaxID=35801 RepID=UPI001F1ADBE6|nr:hypothetical protein [Nitrospina gracilis]MCF8721305.1 hypothetical protein [Nitrospina gracilis Nb-211]